MATDFTIILGVRQHFGNEQGTFNDIEPKVHFAGRKKDFRFPCPNIDPSQAALLMFQSRDVEHQKNKFEVNGPASNCGLLLPASPSRDSWNGNIMLIEPHHKLQETNNVLHIESCNESGGTSGDIDDFMIDNVVIVYKTR